MEPPRAHLRRIVAPAVGIVAATALFAAPQAVHAQSRFRVLVPALKAEGGAKENFGRDVADRLRKSLEAQDRDHAARLIDREFQAAWKNADGKGLRLEDY